MTETLGKYEKMWQEGKMPLQQYAKELIKNGILPSDFDITSHDEMNKVVKYKNNPFYRVRVNIAAFLRKLYQ